MSTEFKVIRTHDNDEAGGDDDRITEPLLASFPANLPTAKALEKMSFNIEQ
jgi:hypothetical protein